MSLDQETINQQQEQLTVHRRRLAHLLQQQATLGAYTPPYVALDIEQTQANIRSIKALLRESGVPVEEHPDDDRPVQVATPLLPALHQLRAPVGDFVGREREIEQLVKALRKSSGTTISGVRGMGGIGKTELAYAAAQHLAGQFPDAQLLVELRGASANPLTPKQALQTVIRSFEREATMPDELNELRNIYCSVLAGKRALILADDAKDAAQVRPLLPPPACALLVTSRNHFELPGMETFDLRTLPKDEAEKLLLKICPRVGTDAPELASLCGYLPLALRVSASLLKSRPSRRVAAYLKQLGDERTKLGHLRDPRDPELDVAASIRLSYDALEEAAKSALCQLSVFPTSFDFEAALDVVSLAPGNEVAMVLEDLCLLSLLEWDEQLERLSLHDLVRTFATARVKDTDRVRLRYARYYAQVADRTWKLYHQGGTALLAGLSLFDRERVHIDTGWTWAREQAGEQEADALLLDFANATVYVGDVRYDKRRERIPQLEAMLAAARRLGRRDAEGVALGNLGVAYHALGDARRAISFHEQQLAVAREISDRRGEGQALGNLGVAYAALGDAQRAITFYEQDLAVAREISDRRGEGQALGNLGVAYATLGDAQRAISFYERRLAIACELGDRRGEGQALGNLGAAYYALGDTRRAISFYEQQLAVARELGDRRGEGQALSNLGAAYYALGDTQRAISFYEQRLAVAHELGDRRGEGQALINLGLAYRSLGDARRAIAFHEQHLEIARELGDRRREGNALGNLGLAYADLGDARKAISFYEQHLAVARELGDRSGEGTTLGNLGIAYADLGDVRTAIDFYEQALTIAREIGNRECEASNCWNLGRVLEKQGDLVRAAELMQVGVDFLGEIGHPVAEKYAAYIEQLRLRLAGGDGGTVAGESAAGIDDENLSKREDDNTGEEGATK